LQPKRRLYSLLSALGVPAMFLYERLHLSPMRTISLSFGDVQSTVLGAGGQMLRSHADNFNRNSMSYVVTNSSRLSEKR
jgi:hypothetical protein